MFCFDFSLFFPKDLSPYLGKFVLLFSDSKSLGVLKTQIKYERGENEPAGGSSNLFLSWVRFEQSSMIEMMQRKVRLGVQFRLPITGINHQEGLNNEMLLFFSHIG